MQVDATHFQNGASDTNLPGQYLTSDGQVSFCIAAPPPFPKYNVGYDSKKQSEPPGNTPINIVFGERGCEHEGAI